MLDNYILLLFLHSWGRSTAKTNIVALAFQVSFIIVQITMIFLNRNSGWENGNNLKHVSKKV